MHKQWTTEIPGRRCGLPLRERNCRAARSAAAPIRRSSAGPRRQENQASSRPCQRLRRRTESATTGLGAPPPTRRVARDSRSSRRTRDVRRLIAPLNGVLLREPFRGMRIYGGSSNPSGVVMAEHALRQPAADEVQLVERADRVGERPPLCARPRHSGAIGRFQKADILRVSEWGEFVHWDSACPWAPKCTSDRTRMANGGYIL